MIVGRNIMEIIKYLGKGSGFWVLIIFMAAVLSAAGFLIKRSKLRNYTGRIIVPLIFIEFASVFGIMALGFPKGSADEVGPGVVPGLWIAGILLLSSFLLVRGLAGKEEADPEWGKTKKVLMFIGMTVLYLFVMQVIGYTVATLAYLIGGMMYLSYRNWKVMVTISIGWVVFSYLVFFKLLYVPLPKGILIERIFG